MQLAQQAEGAAAVAATVEEDLLGVLVTAVAARAVAEAVGVGAEAQVAAVEHQALGKHTIHEITDKEKADSKYETTSVTDANRLLHQQCAAAVFASPNHLLQ